MGSAARRGSTTAWLSGFGCLRISTTLLTRCGIRCSRSIEIQYSPLAILVNVADRLPHLRAGIFRQVKCRKGEPFVAGFAQRASRLQDFNFHRIIGALEAGQQCVLQFRPGTLKEVDQIAIVADSRLEEAVVNIVFEVDSLAIRRVLIARAMQIGHAADILRKNRRKANCNSVRIQRRQCIVANVKIPQGIEDGFAAERRSLAQYLGQHLGLVTYYRFIAFADSLSILILRTRSHPGGEVSGVLVQQVVDTLLEPAPNHRVLSRC